MTRSGSGLRGGKVRPIFRGLRIAVAGDLTRNRSSQWTEANIARWVALREGRFVRAGAGPTQAVNGGGDGVTHLVCDKGEFERRSGRVREALKHQKTCHIVSLDWLEDSMLQAKRLPEEPYSFVRTLKQQREKERRRMMVIKGLEQAEKGVNPNFYHVYFDHTFFRYEIVLTRGDEELGTQGERYILMIHESNAKPHLYWFVIKYYKKKGDPQPKIHRPSGSPGLFSREFGLFEDFFHKKTGIPWVQRLIKAGTTIDKALFQYAPPTGGKPVGWAPAEYIPLDVPERDGTITTSSDPTQGNGVNVPAHPNAAVNENERASEEYEQVIESEEPRTSEDFSIKDTLEMTNAFDAAVGSDIISNSSAQPSMDPAITARAVPSGAGEDNALSVSTLTQTEATCISLP